VVIKKDGRIIDELAGSVKNMNDITNNRVEYLALVTTYLSGKRR